MPKELSMDGGNMEPRARKAHGTDTCTKGKVNTASVQSPHHVRGCISHFYTPLSSLIAINKLTGGSLIGSVCVSVSLPTFSYRTHPIKTVEAKPELTTAFGKIHEMYDIASHPELFRQPLSTSPGVVLFTILNPQEREWVSSPKTPACHVG
ncbi:hypothetical protein PABG_00112 [Paracoccidioides brasiliensis Pb03]|nr:hypothetical protein PABG_00112 [Paracoccidioides brasiliensis Pb03]